MTIFGIVGNLKSFEGTVVFIGFLLFLVILEAIVTNLEVAAEVRGMKDLFEKLQRELMMMGIISFAVFIFQTANPDQHAGALFLSFEMTHIIVLFMALAFITQAVFLVSYASVSGKRYLAAMRTSSVELLTQYKSIKENPLKWWWFHHGPSFLPVFPAFRLDIEFRIIERLFISQHRLSHEFNFAHYVNALFKVYTAELGEVSPISWFLLACLVAINYFRVAIIDPTAKSTVCSRPSEESINGMNSTVTANIRILSQQDPNAVSTSACNTYILIYAYTTASFLSCLILTTYAAATIYLDRIILRSLAVDKINALGRLAYEQSLIIMIRKDKMLAHGILNEFMANSTRLKPNGNGNCKSKRNARMSYIIPESEAKEKELIELHNNNLSNPKILSNMVETVSDIIAGVKRKSISNPTANSNPVYEEKDLSTIFLFSCPRLFFGAVEAILLLQCFYISMVATQLIPLTIVSLQNPGWIIGYLLPIGFNFTIIQILLNKAVLLRAVHTLEKEIAGKICEEALEERNAISTLRSTIKLKLDEEGIPEDEQKSYLHGYFFRYDIKQKNLINQNDFRKILGDLRIYMSRESFHLLWQAADYDLSGSLDGKEIEELFFPKSKIYQTKDKNKDNNDDDNDDNNVSNDIPAVNQLRKSLHQMLSDENIPVFDWDSFLHSAFDKYDTDQSGQLDIDEFNDMLISLKVEISEESVLNVFNEFDSEEDGLVSFNEFFSFFFPQEIV